jgi:WD40 repeat protein
MGAMSADQTEQSRPSRRINRRVLVATASPILAAIVGVLTNLATNRWNWWLVIGLTLAVLVTALLAVWYERPDAARPAAPVAAVPPKRAGPPRMARRPPANTVARPALTDEAWRLLNADSSSAPTVVSLEGPGGFGKTTLAMLLCDRPELAARFPGGVLWATVGDGTSGPALAAEVDRLCEALSGERAGTVEPDAAGRRLGELLAERAPTLVVVDDVWHAEQLEPFLIGGPDSPRLVVTRNAGVAPADASRVHVDVMSVEQAGRVLTASAAGLAEPTMARLLTLTGRWPVLLGLAAAAIDAYVEDGASRDAAAVWVADQLARHGPTGVDVDDAGSRGRAVAATLGTSVGLLSDVERDCYAYLATLPPRAVADTPTLSLLWAARGVAGADVAAVQRKLVRLRLAIGRWSDRHGPALQLHDVIGDYLRHTLGPAELKSRQQRFVDAARDRLPSAVDGRRDAWWSLPPDARYLWDNVAFHLAAAGRTDELAATVCDLRWVEARIQAAGGAATAAADLEYVDTPTTTALRAALHRIGHLLTPIDPPDALAATLASRLAAVPELADLVAAYEPHLARPRLANRWPLPDTDLDQAERHSGGVQFLAVSPDGAVLASVSDDTTVRLWRADDGSALGVLHGHTDQVLSCDFSPDGTVLASASADGTVRLWNPHTLTCERTVRGHDGRVQACRFTSDGATVVTAGGDGTVRLSRSSDGVLVRQLTGHGTRVLDCAVAPDRHTIASVDADGGVRIWDADSGAARAVHSGSYGRVWTCAFSPDSLLLATGADDGAVRLWRASDGAPVRSLPGHSGKVYDLAFSADGSLLASAGADHVIRIWDPTSGVQVRALEGHSWEVWSCAFARDGRLYSADGEGDIRAWDPSTGRPLFHVAGNTDAIWDCVFSPDGQWLAAAGNADARLWETNTGRLGHILAHPDWVAGVRFSRDGKLIATLGGEGTVVLWDGATKTRLRDLVGHTADLCNCDFSPDGAHLVTAGRDGTARLWDTATAEAPHVLQSGVYELFSCAFSPDGSTLALAGHDGTLQLWDPATATWQRSLTGHTEDVTWCEFSPDGTLLASAAQDGRLQCWRPATGETFWLHGHTGGITACRFSPDGTLLATTGYDRTVRVWHVKERRCVCAVRVDSPVYACAWRPDGGGLAAAGLYGTYLFDYLT